jgi:hypothetical protein
LQLDRAQERYLSRRILHFAKEALFWECGRVLTDETKPNDPVDTIDPREGYLGPNVLKKYMAEHRELGVSYIWDPEELYKHWVRFRTFYTGCDLTKGDDVLPAIYGIAQDVAEAMQDEMVVGSWKGRLIQELCWHTVSEATHRPALSEQVPSWSWISSTREVHDNVYFLSDARNMATVKEVLAEKNQIQNVGPIDLVLRGRLIPASFQPSPIYDKNPEIWSTVDELARCEIMVLQDNIQPPDDDTAVVDCHLLPLRYKDCVPEKDELSCAEGIVLSLRDKQSSSYQRIGYWYIRSFPSNRTSERVDILPIYQSADEQIITLI